MCCRLAFPLRRFLPSSGMHLVVLPQYPVKGRLRTQVSALVELICHNKRRWAAPVLGLITPGHHGLTPPCPSVYSPSSLGPQIASAFFDRVSNAAVSANAFSLRRSSDSSFLIRFISAAAALRSRLVCSSD